jgi:hypothetical protein
MQILSRLKPGWLSTISFMQKNKRLPILQSIPRLKLRPELINVGYGVIENKYHLGNGGTNRVFEVKSMLIRVIDKVTFFKLLYS